MDASQEWLTILEWLVHHDLGLGWIGWSLGWIGWILGCIGWSLGWIVWRLGCTKVDNS